MIRPVFLSSSQLAVYLMENVSLRPKTLSLPLLGFGGLGMFYALKMLPPREKRDEPKQKREFLLWDFYDPQGHHKISWD